MAELSDIINILGEDSNKDISCIERIEFVHKELKNILPPIYMPMLPLMISFPCEQYRRHGPFAILDDGTYGTLSEFLNQPRVKAINEQYEKDYDEELQRRKKTCKHDKEFYHLGGSNFCLNCGSK